MYNPIPSRAHILSNFAWICSFFQKRILANNRVHRSICNCRLYLDYIDNMYNTKSTKKELPIESKWIISCWTIEIWYFSSLSLFISINLIFFAFLRVLDFLHLWNSRSRLFFNHQWGSFDYFPRYAERSIFCTIK